MAIISSAYLLQRIEKKPVTLDVFKEFAHKIMEKERRKASEDASKEPFKRYMEAHKPQRLKVLCDFFLVQCLFQKRTRLNPFIYPYREPSAYIIYGIAEIIEFNWSSL